MECRAMPMRRAIVLFLGAGVLMAASLAASIAADSQTDLQLPIIQGSNFGTGAGFALSLGSVGMDARAGTSRWAAVPEDPYRFSIPSERPAHKVPGLLLRVPFGGP